MPVPAIESGDVVDAVAKVLRNGRTAVHVTFSQAAGERLMRLTQDHLGQHIAIAIDDEIINFVKINSAVGTEAHITGSFSDEDARRWADAFRRAATSKSVVE